MTIARKTAPIEHAITEKKSKQTLRAAEWVVRE